MSNPQDEAIATLKLVLDSFFTGTVDIKNILRHCVHACQILGWNEQRSWFDNELLGYPNGVELPAYRRIIGHTKWVPTGGFGTVLDSVINNQHRTTEEPTKSVNLDVRAGIDFIISAAQHGHREHTGNKSTRYISFRSHNIEIEELNNYDNSLFQIMIQNIENLVFDFVSKSYSLLRYGDVLQDIWQGYRREVDKRLIDIGFDGH